MSESTKDEFNRLIRALLKRDGRTFTPEGEDKWTALAIGELRILLVDDKLDVTLPSQFGDVLPGMRLQVFNDQNEEYSIEHMSEWIPKLRRLLVLERLADV